MSRRSLSKRIPRKTLALHRIRITWLVHSTGTTMRGLARWKGKGQAMTWVEADAEGCARADGLLGQCERADEGRSWCRGWDTPDVEALLAARALERTG